MFHVIYFSDIECGKNLDIYIYIYGQLSTSISEMKQ